QYDGIDRITALYSSDGTIHHEYHYAQGPDPTQIIDYIHQFRIQRAYNLFGELLHEQGAQGFEYTWAYDEKGRCTQFLLPDHSAIQYGYTGAHLATITRTTADKVSLYTHSYTKFDPNGHIAEERLIDGSSIQSIQRDLLERPIAQTSNHFNLTTAYGPSGLVTETYNSLFGGKGYQYDPLNQLVQEGSETYLFDSYGNPTDCLVNDHHQILKTPELTLDYDPDGNPISRSGSEGETSYEFDLLGRLLTIQFPDRTVRYTYDPLSRLLFKEIEEVHGAKTQITYLYDQNFEIGTATLDGQILELKVLGLGIRGDIGAAVAIELGGRHFAPQHDFNGHIIALLSMEGSLSDLSNIDAFGTALTFSQNPWQFCSKRSEEGFVFFGERFYDPVLKRWLTPDPAGPVDGPNLYLYVMNSPMNRLDLFGLSSEDRKYPWSVERNDPPNIELDRSQIDSFHRGEPVECRGSIDGVTVNFVVSCQHAHQLQFSAEELEQGKINLFDHLSELVPKEGAAIGLVTWQNGMNVNRRDFRRMSKLITKQLPEGTLGIGIHNPTGGFFTDFRRVVQEFHKIETPIVSQTRQMLSVFIETLPAINPTGHWLHICHSEGGLIARNSIEGMTGEQQQQMNQYFSCIGLGPAAPLPKCYADYSINCYSDKDKATGWCGMGRSEEEYNIKRIECETPSSEWGFFEGDHAFSGRTYQRELKKQLENLREKYGFYQNR
ncbi:MAG: RHS repeat-associated core domain-containing protein, partial [Verrucomicrobia bacterium]|nr:RHS repeat-associated core domain-containing protein [Verrucomicrobiota bacterium]